MARVRIADLVLLVGIIASTALVSAQTPDSPGLQAARSLPWTMEKTNIMAQGRPVRDVLADFGQQQGLKIITSGTEEGMISGEFQGLPPAYFLDQICQAYNLTWFFAGGILYVSPAEQITVQMKTLRFVTQAEALRVIGDVVTVALDGVVRPLPSSDMLMVTGPPQFIELVSSLLDTVDSEQKFRLTGETVVELFPLTHAWAYDITLDTGSGVASQVNGVATTLANLINGNTGAPGSNPGAFRIGSIPRQVRGALAEGANVAVVPAVPSRPGPITSQQVDSTFENPGANAIGAANLNNAQIIADVRTNSVIIRDTRENMAFYAQLIRKLDVPVRVVEISAAIVDVRAGNSASLGVSSVGVTVDEIGIGSSTINSLLGTDSSSSTTTGTSTTETSGTGGVSTATTSASNDTASGSLAVSTTAPGGGIPPNIVASAVFGTASVTAAINALTENNKAKILSRPTILTLDNFGALISQQETFYINSVGQYVSDLFNVSTGLSLQVVPHIVHEPAGQKVAIQVRIEDGTTGAEADGTGLPTVRQSTLTTQAVIGKDQSLLIGGLFLDSTQQQTSGLPGLSKIPILGYFFSSNARGKNLVERLFLITPRVIDVSSSKLGDYAEYFKPSPTVQHALDRNLPPADVPPQDIQEYDAITPRKNKGWPLVPGR